MVLYSVNAKLNLIYIGKLMLLNTKIYEHCYFQKHKRGRFNIPPVDLKYFQFFYQFICICSFLNNEL